MKKIRFYSLITVLIIGCLPVLIAQPQLLPQVHVQIYAPLLANTITPEGILGERKISAKFQRQVNVLQPAVDINPQSVYLYYSQSENGSMAQNLNPNEARNSQDLGVTPARLVNNRWELILPHSGNRNGSIGANNFEFKGGKKVYYKWHITFSDGKTETTKINNFTMPRPLNIAVMGDSYGSGEGAPMQGRLWISGGNNCHRSENAGEFKAVQQFASSNPHIAVVYKPFFVSCSGAQTKNIIDSVYSTGFCDNQGNTPEPTQLKQIRLVFENPSNYKEDIQGKIDAVVISIGGNDAGFSDAVIDAFKNNLASKIGDYTVKLPTINKSYDELRRAFDSQCIKYVFTTEYPDPTTDENGRICGLPQSIGTFLIMALLESTYQSEQNAGEFLCDVGEAVIEFFIGDNNRDDCGESGLFDSPNYDYLINYIRCNMANSNNNGLASAEVMANGFMDLVRIIVASGGSYKSFVRQLDACIPSDGAPSNANVFSTLLATQDDIRAARNGFLVPMNDIIGNKANEFRRNGFPNWHFVNGTMDASRLHGICTCNGDSQYFNSLLASFDQQGSMYGTMHMNTRGQTRVLQPLVLRKMQEVITMEARRAMFSNVCPAPFQYSMSNSYLNLLVNNDVKKAKHDEAIQVEFKKLYDKIKPIANRILTKLDPKTFATQYKNKSFGAMRSARFQRQPIRRITPLDTTIKIR
jgi:hypothetical protein